MYRVLRQFEGAVGSGYWGRRLLGELTYAMRLSEATATVESAGVEPGRLAEVAAGAAASALEALRRDRAVTPSLVQELEARFAPFSAALKATKLHLAGHAHIDMNWLWSTPETVTVVLETFRTVLSLLNEFPSFTFSQSQAAVYDLVDRYEPEMMPDIASRVAEGRWEPVAGQWVETDMNMPSTESLVRQLLYSRRYLERRFGITDGLQTIFLPDTFGHGIHTPEILASAGIRYYYFCRGAADAHLYRWRAPSGAELLVQREAQWYNEPITPAMLRVTAEQAVRHGVADALVVYGVGDHGGGPTRADILRALDIQTWPVAPQVVFGTYAGFFGAVVEAVSAGIELPVVTDERNFIFTGCYSSQSEIKRANRRAELGLGRAELLDGCAAGDPTYASRREEYAGAWRHVLFSQFHDILPGSGVAGTRDYALGTHQEVAARCISGTTRALRALADLTEYGPTPGEPGDSLSTSQTFDGFDGFGALGAGVGYKTSMDRLPQTGRDDDTGVARFLVYNPDKDARSETVELTVWNRIPADAEVSAEDDEGRALPVQTLDRNAAFYWGHQYTRLLTTVSVPGFSYRTVTVRHVAPDTLSLWVGKVGVDGQLVRSVPTFRLENEFLSVTFDSENGDILSLIDRVLGVEVVGEAGTRLYREDGGSGMTAWVRREPVSAMEPDRIDVTGASGSDGDLERRLTVTERYGSTTVALTYRLLAGEPTLRVDAEVRWREVGEPQIGVPALDFMLGLASPVSEALYDVPGGPMRRPALAHDVPALSLAAVETEGKRGLQVTTIDGGYGMRCDGDSVGLTLLRASYDPDPTPEVGDHQYSFAISLLDEVTPATTMRASRQLRSPFLALSIPRPPTEPAKTLLTVDAEHTEVVAVKAAEDGDGVVVRLLEIGGVAEDVEIGYSRPLQSAEVVDSLERPTVRDGDASVKVDGERVRVVVGAHRLTSLRLRHTHSGVNAGD